MRTIVALALLSATTTAAAEPSREECLALIAATHDCIHKPGCQTLTLEDIKAELRCMDLYDLDDVARAANEAAMLKYEAIESDSDAPII